MAEYDLGDICVPILGRRRGARWFPRQEFDVLYFALTPKLSLASTDTSPPPSRDAHWQGESNEPPDAAPAGRPRHQNRHPHGPDLRKHATFRKHARVANENLERGVDHASQRASAQISR